MKKVVINQEEKIKSKEKAPDNRSFNKESVDGQEQYSTKRIKNIDNGKPDRGHKKKTIEVFTAGQGNYKDKNNRIAQCNLSLEEDAQGFLCNHHNHFHSKFGKTIQDAELASLEKDGHKIFMNYQPKGKNFKSASKRKLMKSEKTNSKVKYENIESGVDLEYELTTGGIKENIIVKQKQEEYVYQFALHIGKLTPRFNEESKTLELLNNGKAVYRLSSPYMLDHNGVFSDDCSYEIKESEAGILNIQLIADSQWIHDSRRVFPVVIDPTIDVINNDVFSLSQLFNNRVLPSTSETYSVGHTDKNAVDRYLIRINIDNTAIQELYHNKINRAYLNLYVDSISDFVKPDKLFRLDNGFGLLMDIRKSNIKDKISFDITSAIEMRDDALYLWYVETDAPSNLEGDQIMKIFSQYAADEAKRPQMLLEYGDSETAEVSQIKKEYPIGRAGTTSVSLLDGSFTHEHADCSISHNALNIGISHVFNSKVFNGEPIRQTYMGQGWKTNLHQYLIKNPDFNKLLGSKDITYIDGSGFKHELHEQWYYVTDDKVKHFVNREDVYLDADQKLKYKVDDAHIFEVKYDVKSDEGLSYVSGMSLTNYKVKRRKATKYFAKFGYGNKEIDINNPDNHLQFYYYSPKTGDKVYLAPLSVFKNTDGYLANNNGVPVCIDTENATKITKISDGSFTFSYVYTTFQGEPDGSSYTKVSVDNGGVIIVEEIEEEQSPLEDVYLNEDLVNIDAQIKNVRGYIDDLKFSQISTTKSYMNLLNQFITTVRIYNKQENLSKYEATLNDIQDSLNNKQKKFYSDKGNECLYAVANKKLRDHESKEIDQHFAINLNDLNYYQYDKFDLSKEASSVLNVFNNLYQRKSNIETASAIFENAQDNYKVTNKEIQRINIKSSLQNAVTQIESYDRELGNIARNIEKYNEQLSNLLDREKALIKEQKKSVNDFLIDKENNTLGFDGYGRLILITDAYENKIEIEYGYEEENEGQLLAVFSETQKIRFHYDKESKLLASMTDPQGRKTKYAYDGGKLISITYSDKKKSTFAYDDFSGTSSLLERNVIARQSDGSMVVKQYCYDGRIDQTTVLQGMENTKKLIDHKYTFDSDYRTTTVTDDMRKEANIYYFDYLGRVIKQVDKETTSVAFYEQKNLKSETTYHTYDDNTSDEGSPVLEYLSIHDGPAAYQIDLNKFKTASGNKLPISNVVGLLLEVLIEGVNNPSILSFKVRALVSSTAKDGALKSEVFEQEYQEIKLQTLVLPICIDRELSYRIDIEITSDSPDFIRTYFNAVELIKLEEGKIYAYDNQNRLIKEQNGYDTVTYEDYNEDDIPSTKIEANIYGDEVITHYNFNSDKKLTCVEDSLGNVEEYYYNDKGLCIEKRTYNKKDASLMKVERTSYDEQGRLVSSYGAIKDSKGIYPKKEITYLPGSSVESKVKEVNGESSCFSYDFHNGDLLSISSSASGINNSTSFTYNYGLLTSLSHHGMKVDYAYDGQGRKTKINLNGEDVVWNVFVDHYYNDEIGIVNGAHTTSTTLEGLFTENFVNDKGQKVLNKYSGDDSYGETTFTYEKDQVKEVLSSITYRENEEVYQEQAINTYDEFGTLVKQDKKINNSLQLTLENHYDENQRFIASSDVILPEDEYRLNYLNSYDEEHRLNSVTVREGIIDNEEFFTDMETVSFDYDALGRVGHQTLNTEKMSMCYEYTYLQQDENTLDLIAEGITKIKIKNGSNIEYLTETSTYEYDVSGNIVSIETDETKTRYQYDNLNRLIREDNPLLNKTIIYKYDKAGNILLRKTYPYSLEENLVSPEVKEYVYDCEKGRDRLISFDGQAIEYNENSVGGKMGYPTTYRGSEFEWNNNGQLTSLLTQNMDSIDYLYDTNGIRRKKIVNGLETSFITNGTQILEMKQENKTIIFRYAVDKLIGFNYNNGKSGKEYIYLRNIQGDIISIFDDSGNQVGGYSYDAYGNHVVTLDVDGIASLNPFRYRGYFYDEETKLYYLNARYYDPETGRFISPDTLSVLDETRGQINGLNLYMYCGDNPVMRIDPSGCAWWNWLIAGIQLAVGVILVATGVGAGLGATLIIGGLMGIAMQFVSPAVAQFVGGLGSIANGWGALSTAISLFAFGPIGIVAGIVLGTIGLATMIVGANDVVAGATGTNYIQKLTGWSDSTYGWVNFGLNLASAIGTVAGRLGMRQIGTKTVKSHDRVSSEGQKPYAKITRGDNTYYFDGKGNAYWAKHHIYSANTGNSNGFHWHVGMGGDDQHIYSFIVFILKLIKKG